MERHQRDERAVAADRVLVGVERDLLEEGREGRVASPARATRARPRRAPGGSRSGPAPRSSARPRATRGSRCAASTSSISSGTSSSCAADMSDSIVPRNAFSAFCGAAPTPAFAASAVASQSEISRWSAHVCRRARRRVADAATRPVGDPQQRDGVVRVVEHLEVGDEVLDLGALVEARAADHLVRDRPGARGRPRARGSARSCGRRPRPRCRRSPPRRAARSRRRRSAPRRARPRPRRRAPGRRRRAPTRGSSPCARGCGG